MAKRRKIRGRRKVPFRHVFVALIITFMILTMWGLWIVNKQVTPVLMNIATTKAKQIASYAINYGIKKSDVRQMENGNKLIIRNYNKNKDTETITYNAAEVSRILATTTANIQLYLRLVEEGQIDAKNMNFDELSLEDGKKGAFAEIPLGQATNNVLFANLGPRIPVRLEVLGNVNSKKETKVTQLPINNVYVKIYNHVTVDVKIVIPFATQTIQLTTDIPIVDQFIPGDVPIYWGGGNTGGGGPAVLMNGDDKKDSDKKSGIDTKSNTDTNSNKDTKSNPGTKANTNTKDGSSSKTSQ